MIPSTTSTSQITPLAPARLTTDRETHRSARNSTTHVELKRLTDRKLRVFANLTPRSLLFPLGCEWELRKKVLRTKHHTNRFAVFFASLRLCVSHPHPSHGHRGPCYGAMLRGHATGPCYGAMLRGHATGPCYGAMLRGHATERSCPPSLERDNLLLKNQIIRVPIHISIGRYCDHAH